MQRQYDSRAIRQVGGAAGAAGRPIRRCREAAAAAAAARVGWEAGGAGGCSCVVVKLRVAWGWAGSGKRSWLCWRWDCVAQLVMLAMG